MEFTKTWQEIRLPNKSYQVILTYAPGCKVYFKYVYNSISMGYMGLTADSFVETIRGLLRVCPDFFELDLDRYRETFEKIGFAQTDPTESDIRMYSLLNQ